MATTLLEALFVVAAVAVQQRPCEPQPAAEVRPSRDLYCLELLPAAGVRDASGVVELGHVPGPFTVAVTAEGNQRYAAGVRLQGLPDPSTLGDYTTYVAWVTTPLMHPWHKLGEVRNGLTALGEIALDKFIVVVSAEPSAAVTERTGRLVLRGQSPSSRMRPPDVLEWSLGAVPAEAPHEHGHDVPGGWVAPPMPAGLTMLPAEMRLAPRVSPYLPPVAATAEIPAARPRELARLSDGDTLALEATYLRRTIHGKTYVMYGFNGQYPGPLILVPQAATIVVRFTNRIDWPTTVHWHGVRLDNRFDGVPHVTQEPIPPGGSFVYRIRFPDAGIYWYHPHLREDVQQDMGLYGNMLVRSPRSDYFSPANREEVLMLDDLLIGDAGLVPYGREAATHTLMGRFGNVFLVNGEPFYEATARAGEVVRFFLTNVSNTRTFNLSLPGARLKVVGSDVGNYEREAWIESIVIGPAERYIVHARFDAPGDVFLVNRVRAIDHLYGRFFAQTDTLGVVHVTAESAVPDHGASFARVRRDTAVTRELDAYRSQIARPIDHTLELRIEAAGLPPLVERLMQLDSAYFHPAEWSGTMPMMNWASTTREVRWILRDPATGRENMNIDWRFRVGDVVKIRLSNERNVFHAMQHPIHIHGQRFLILEQNGVPNDNLVWKDTMLLPVGATADILLELSNPGRWMLHCHIAEHIEAGMHMVFEVQGQ
jgi:suppressor of ftsI